MQIDLMEILLEGKERFEFQEYCERYFDAKYGTDFERVDPDGSNGDGGRDGYCWRTGEYFAISSASKLIQKIKKDFISCITKNYDVEIFTFVTNQKQTPKFVDTVKLLRRENPGITVNILTHKSIAANIFDLPQNQIKKILGRDVDLSENTVYFHGDEDKSVTFTMSQAINESMHFYLLFLVLASLSFGLFYMYHGEEVLMNIFMFIILGFFFLYFHFNRENLKKYKAPHKILYLIFSEKLPVGAEILFDVAAHKTIRRNGFWNFTFNKRSIYCTKNGCNGKVYIHESADYVQIGRCEKDNVNHVYRIDNNFYGELL